jgi:hypothetical protein
MHTVLDSVFSLILGGLILLSIHRFNTGMAEVNVEKAVTTSVQMNVRAIGEVLETDIRKAGLSNFTRSNFIHAESTSVAFRGDLDGDGELDSVRYHLGTTPDATQINPRARVLYRTVNGSAPFPIHLGITRLRFRYYDAAGNQLQTAPEVPAPAAIRSVELAFSIETGSYIRTTAGPDGVVMNDTTFSRGQWAKLITPVNLR